MAASTKSHANGRVTPKQHRPATLDDLYGREKRREPVPVHLSESAFRSYEEAAQALAVSEDDETKAAHEAAAKALDDSTVWVTFEELPRPDYDALVTSHPATDEQDKDHRERFGYPAPYHMEEFPIALVAASAVEPTMSEDEVRRLWQTWPFTELNRLWSAALAVNSQPRQVTSLGKGWSGTRS